MAISKTGQAFATLSASGTSETLDTSTYFGVCLNLRNANGTVTGSMSSVARMTVKGRVPGVATWHEIITVTGSWSPGTIDHIPPIAIPDGYASVEVVYTAPGGLAGSTLDGEIGRVAT